MGKNKGASKFILSLEVLSCNSENIEEVNTNVPRAFKFEEV